MSVFKDSYRKGKKLHLLLLLLPTGSRLKKKKKKKEQKTKEQNWIFWWLWSTRSRQLRRGDGPPLIRCQSKARSNLFNSKFWNDPSDRKQFVRINWSFMRSRELDFLRMHAFLPALLRLLLLNYRATGETIRSHHILGIFVNSPWEIKNGCKNSLALHRPLLLRLRPWSKAAILLSLPLSSYSLSAVAAQRRRSPAASQPAAAAAVTAASESASAATVGLPSEPSAAACAAVDQRASYSISGASATTAGFPVSSGAVVPGSSGPRRATGHLRREERLAVNQLYIYIYIYHVSLRSRLPVPQPQAPDLRFFAFRAVCKIWACNERLGGNYLSHRRREKKKKNETLSSVNKFMSRTWIFQSNLPT